MLSNIVPSDISNLLDQWIEAEKNGIQFPVPFDIAYPIAGYARKDSAKRYLPKSAQAGLYHVSGIQTKGRPIEQISLSIAGLEHLCLMADTPEGYQVREYFRDSRSKWEMVKEIAPDVAQEIEILKLKRDIATQEAIAAVAQEKALALRHWANTALEPADRDRVLGVTEIKTIEYRKTVVDNSGFVLNAGDTLNKSQLCQEFGFVTRTGNPDYKAINKLLEEAQQDGAIKSPWKEVQTVAAVEFDVRQLETLKAYYQASPAQRQRWIGE